MVRRQNSRAFWDAETWRPCANIGATTIDWALRSDFVTRAILAGFSQRTKRRQRHCLAWSRHSCRFNRLYGTVTRKGTFFGIILVPQREKKIDKTGPDPLEPAPSIPCA